MSITKEWGGGETLTAGDDGRGVFTDRNGQSVPVRVLQETPRGGVIFRTDGGSTYRKEGEPTIRLTGATLPFSRPMDLDGPSIRTAVPHANPSASWRFPFTMRGALRAIAPEYVPGPGANVFRQNLVPPPPEPVGQLWTLIGKATVPQDPNVPVVLIEDRVPLGNRLRLVSFLTQLGPSTLYDENYIWRLQVGGFDLWNPFSTIAREGRPNPSDAPALISPSVEECPVFGPGTPIRVTVSAVQPITATDTLKVALNGILWGDL